MIMKSDMRVGAILSESKEAIQFLGYGVYEGDFEFGDVVSMNSAPERHTKEWAEWVQKIGVNNSLMYNPRIKLDSGEYVWGAECWWGGEQDVKSHLEYSKNCGIMIVPTSIVKVREESEVGSKP